jgi:hypothetical protein
VRFLHIAEICREKSHSIALASAALLQQILGACSSGHVLHLQLAASVPHDFSNLADEFMAIDGFFMACLVPICFEDLQGLNVY